MATEPNRIPEILSSDVKDEIFLKNSLRPLWKTTYHFGLLLNWCRDPPEPCHIITRLLRKVGIFLSTFLLLFNSCFQIVQYFQEILEPTSTVHSLIPNLMWVCVFPAGLIVAILFLVHHKKFVSFFNEWAVMEVNLIPTVRSRRNYDRLYRFVYAFYLVTGIVLPFGISIVVLSRTEASFLLSHYAILRDTLTIPVILSYHVITGFLVGVFICLSDLVPSWTFYHAGLVLQHLAAEVKQSCERGKRECGSNRELLGTNRIILRYGKLSRLTDKANQFFGVMMVVDQTAILVMVCALLYTVTSTIKVIDLNMLLYLSGLILFIARMMICNLMASHLSSSYVKLKVVLAKAVCTNERMDPAERKRVQHLLSWMSQTPLCARPLNIYCITPSNLMTVSSLVISYVIVLLQTK